MDQLPIWDYPAGHCGLPVRHIAHRFVDLGAPVGPVFACSGAARRRPGEHSRDPSDVPQLRHTPDAQLIYG